MPGSSTTLLASWIVPEYPRGIISGYKLSCYAGLVGTTNFEFNSTVTTAILKDLRGFTKYRCSIRAVNGAGPGRESEQQYATTNKDGK